MSTAKKPSNAVAKVMPALLPVKELLTAIDKHNGTMSKAMDTYQQLGVQCLMHLDKSGDIGPANRLLSGMPSGIKRNSMGSWLLAYGALSVSQNTATRKEAPLAYAKDKKTRPEEAMADHWTNHLPEKELDDVFDLQKALHGLLQRAKGKTIQLNGRTMAVEEATKTLRIIADMAGEEGYTPEVKHPQGVPARRATDKTDGEATTTQAADAPKEKATKRLPAAA